MNGKKLIQSKTFWASVLVIVGSVGNYFTGAKTIEQLIPAVVAAVFAILRLYTNKPIVGIK